MCCKDLCSRSISKVYTFVLLGVCLAVAIIGIPLTIYGFKWDTTSQTSYQGLPTLFNVYTLSGGYSISDTIDNYRYTLGWAGYLVSPVNIFFIHQIRVTIALQRYFSK